MKKYILTLAIVMVLAANNSMAQTNKRQAKQKARIAQGVASGEITAQEAAHIKQKQNEVQVLENAARADGKVTKKEQAVIRHEQNEASRQIERKKHNRRDRN